MRKQLHLSVILASVTMMVPHLVHAQAQIWGNTYGSEFVGSRYVFDYQINSYNETGTNLSTPPTYPSGTADLITHSLSASSSAAPTVWSAATPWYGFESSSNAELTDTVTFNKSGLVTFSMTALGSAEAGSGNDSFCSAGISVSGKNVVGSYSSISAGDYAQNIEDEGFWNDGISSSFSKLDYYGSENLSNWNNDLSLTFYAVKGEQYTFSSLVKTGAGSVDGIPSGEGASASVDPTWTLGVGQGVTYSTGSGYQIAAVPEPSTLVSALGALGVFGLAARRRKVFGTGNRNR